MKEELSVLQEWLARAQAAQAAYAGLTAEQRNAVLEAVRGALYASRSDIFLANAQDQEVAKAQGLSGALLRRLVLNQEKLTSLLEGIGTVIGLADPLGKGSRRNLDNGLRLESIRVPLGVIGLIYESRPGVTIESTGLILKSGNGLLLRGGHEALHTNRILVRIIREVLASRGIAPDLVQLIDDPDRSWVHALMQLKGLDLLIPRGGAELIRRVNAEATVPVIETGVGNCHVYVDADADLDMALRIVRDAKMGNPSVCNAAESLLVHRAIAAEFLPRLEDCLAPYDVQFHADQTAMQWLSTAIAATEADFYQEYLDAELAVAVVDDVDAAIRHVNRYGSHHSEAIVTNHYANGLRFQSGVDAAVVYWNASTRFTDGFQFGLGAEVGISTQKLHARGPMGLEALTTEKTLVWGQGQTRDIP